MSSDYRRRLRSFRFLMWLYVVAHTYLWHVKNLPLPWHDGIIIQPFESNQSSLIKEMSHGLWEIYNLTSQHSKKEKSIYFSRIFFESKNVMKCHNTFCVTLIRPRRKMTKFLVLMRFILVPFLMLFQWHATMPRSLIIFAMTFGEGKRFLSSFLSTV